MDYISREAARETLLTEYPLLQRERLDAKCLGCKNFDTAICNRCDMFYDEFDPIETRRQTNADRIRSMTDEKLAKWLTANNPSYSPFDPMTEPRIYTCSNCGYIDHEKNNYCSKCGAKMEESK